MYAYKILALLSLVVMVLPFFVLAHTVKTDGSISVFLHVDPNDTPAAQESATFYLQVTDRTKKFVPEQCDCRIEIQKNGEILFAKVLAIEKTYIGVEEFIFPEAGLYQIRITGEARDRSFDSFSAVFDQRVERVGFVPPPPKQSSSFTPEMWWCIFACGVMFVAGGVLYTLLHTRKRKS